MATVAETNIESTKHHRKVTAYTRWQWFCGYLFLMPWLIGFFFFQLLPIVFTLFLSFTDYAGTSEFKWGNFNMVGLENYQHLLVDPIILPSIGVTLKFALIGIPLGLIVPLGLAVLVNSRNLVGSNFFRTLFASKACIRSNGRSLAPGSIFDLSACRRPYTFLTTALVE